MIDKQEEIINKINELNEVKEYKRLKKILNENLKYQELLQLANKNENDQKEIIEIRKQLFLIPEFKEYIDLDMKLRLFFNKIGKKISSIVSNHTCIR